ncbi:TPA: hypothetical protein DEO28_05025 [Candidatus Dependentiae bacterium]|nr:MAG: hypothetical protein UR14_C0002G0118 [candidate division TM6 bacterium GW2011_GWE2_31_21]KKP53915.1 MAG: hypothetical protein UR43_C0002G0118 [candidate division TM6 bacterium GW2011_GWF2_33_332]HBS47695.1 hypothetical protein [Candidatus Dependentiae bacterium]HBZ73844.1 hypothetical protein [Candidatus Dependentiae bacterium]
MERVTDIALAKQIFKTDFIGPEELENISNLLGIKKSSSYDEIPLIPYSLKKISELVGNYVLILGIPNFIDGSPLNLIKMRDFLGINSYKKEPCFYNQDWYLNESFAKQNNIEFSWYLIRKNIFNETRGILPGGYKNNLKMPSALLCAYVFFSYYFHTKGQILWSNEYVWCSDFDHNNDQVYVGRYLDSSGINKNGFSIHRHLKIKKFYGSIDIL